MFVTYFLLLSSLGLAIVTQAQDCSKPPGGDNMSLKGDDILLQTFPEGKQVTFACNVGYTTVGGSASITCRAGAWTILTLKCDRKECGPAGEVENGNVDYPEGTQFGDKLVVTCNTGYNMVPNRGQVLCGAQGWMDRLPECEVVTCDPPPVVDNAVFHQVKDSYNYREVVQYKCQDDYTLSGSTSISCSEHGTFGPAPTCIRVQCQELKIDNAHQVDGSRPPHGYRATVTYKCVSGYVMEGERSLTCGIDSQWFPELPTCRRMPDTTKPPTTTTTTTTTTTHSPPTPPAAHSSTTYAAHTTTTSTEPYNHGHKVAIGVVVCLVFLSVVVGVVLYMKKRQRPRRDCPDSVAPKVKEDVEVPLRG